MDSIPIAKTIDDFKVGDAYRFSRIVSSSDIITFAELSGDQNPIHLDESYARNTRFGGRIVHGAFLVALISKALGMDLPGIGAIYLSQYIEFLAPAFVGDEVTVEIKVEELDFEARVLSIRNQVTNVKGALLAQGISKIKLPKKKS